MSDDAYLSGPADQPGHKRARILIGLLGLVAAALLAVLLVLVQRSISQRDAALARAQHSYAVVILTGEVEGALARAEAALGRFVIDGDRRTGTVYYDEWRHAGHLLDELDSLIAENPLQAKRMDELRTLYAQRGIELALPAARANYKQGWPALSLFARAGRSETLPRISAVLRAVADAETALLDARSSAAAVRVDRANNLSLLLSGVGALLALSVLGLGWAVTSVIADKLSARAEADQEMFRAARLAEAVAERTAELSDANDRLLEEARTREAAEAKLRQVQKMDAVGQLTGGIAHDFNNMLAVVLGGLEMAKRRVEEQAEEATRHIDSALEGASRAAALTRRLLSFARAEPLLPDAVAPGHLLREMSDLVDRAIGERIEVRILTDTDVWPVWADSYQLENAILNLAVNARDAMAGVGTLVMSATNVYLGPSEVGELPAGDYVRIAVIDNGAGMSATTLERVFEPFFTTKPAGQGTGLGLSQILGLTRQSGGDVAISSTPGQGTTVSLYLPRYTGVAPAPRAAAPATPAASTTAPTPARLRADVGGRVLLVEDDARVRAASAAALTELGCSIVACASGEEAITALAREPDLALLMTDVVMPGMTGPELVKAVRARRPDLPVLFVTGYVGEAGEAENFKGSAMLRKPFTLRALADALGTVGRPAGPHEQAA